MNLEGLDDVTYKPISNLVHGFKPPNSCHDHILQDLPSIFVDIPEIPSIVEECSLVTESCLEHLPPNIPRLTFDEALAIAVYSYDLGMEDVTRNLYFALNDLLRERDPMMMRKLKPFLTYLMNGLSKLPPVEATVYRGVPNSIIFRIKILTGRSINISVSFHQKMRCCFHLIARCLWWYLFTRRMMDSTMLIWLSIMVPILFSDSCCSPQDLVQSSTSIKFLTYSHSINPTHYALFILDKDSSD
jgi:hypothetical protein